MICLFKTFYENLYQRKRWNPTSASLIVRRQAHILSTRTLPPTVNLFNVPTSRSFLEGEICSITRVRFLLSYFFLSGSNGELYERAYLGILYDVIIHCDCCNIRVLFLSVSL
jgi:hypothetical protein